MFEARADTIRAVTEQACALVGAAQAGVLLIDNQSWQLRCRYPSFDLAVEGARQFQLPLYEDNLSARVVREGQPYVTNQAAVDANLIARFVHLCGTRQMVSCPLNWQGVPLGVLHVINKVHGDFDARDARVLATMAPILSMTLIQDAANPVCLPMFNLDQLAALSHPFLAVVDTATLDRPWLSAQVQSWVDPDRQHLVLADTTNDPRHIALQLYQNLVRTEFAVWAPLPENWGHHWTVVESLHQELSRGLEFLKKARGSPGVHSWNRLQSAASLLHAPTTALELLLAPLRPLASQTHKGVLLAQSAHAYLQAGDSADQAARLLHVHANTVRYRIDKIRQAGISLKASDRFGLLAGLKLYLFLHEPLLHRAAGWKLPD